MTKCQGCGLTLQSTDEQQAGYIPVNKNTVGIYCQRCFRLKNYQQYDLKAFKPLANQKIIQKINKDQALVFFLIDFLNLNSEVITTFKMLKDPKVLLISKSDILPPRTSKERIINRLKRIYQITEPIAFIKYNQGNIINKFALQYKLNKIYLTGYTNSGKSTYLNQYINEDIIITSFLPHTTNDYIALTQNGLKIIDCPGFDYQTRLEHNPALYKLALNKPLKPLTYQLKIPQTFIINNDLELSITGEGSITFYLPPAFKIKRLYHIKNTDQQIEVPAQSDIVIKTLGFINVKNACQLMVSTEVRPFIEIRETIY